MALATALALTDRGLEPETSLRAAAAAILLIGAHSLLQRWAFRYRATTEIVILVELTGVAVLVGVTGVWESPFLLFAFAPVLDAGFLSGLRAAIAVAILATLSPALVSLVGPGTHPAPTDTFRAAAPWGFGYLLCACLAAYGRQQTRALAASARRLVDERMESEQRLTSMEDANALLVALHRVAQSLPATLDLDGLVQTTLQRLQDLVPSRAAAVLLKEGGAVRVLGARGMAPELTPIPVDTAPATLRVALERPVAAAVTAGSGLDPATREILYAPLLHDGEPTGLLAVEDPDVPSPAPEDVRLLESFARSVAVALDNALMFSRLRLLAASEERTRIAREVHDRTAQQLVFLGFELDRLSGTAQKTGADFAPDIEDLAVHVRSTIEDLRESIGLLRVDVNDHKGLTTLLRQHVADVSARTGLAVDLELPAEGIELPRIQERELWRICQESIHNVVKHAGATSLLVRYQVDHERAEVVVEDNGCGFDPRIRKPGHFGLAGMRERATAIGAELDLQPVPGGGTAVRVTLRRDT